MAFTSNMSQEPKSLIIYANSTAFQCLSIYFIDGLCRLMCPHYSTVSILLNKQST